jgi:hypothetical protein
MIPRRMSYVLTAASIFLVYATTQSANALDWEGLSRSVVHVDFR